ncbi:SDR family oxidoreductase [Streptomyces sp. ME19-01-6]|uniref:SDR family oxidoreductase n=1 Tax=Streptomyces sp. ME19-01-6 TaxID=3028686 RepID=UPI0029BE5F6E|nr:DUF2867 domain-containing protein [Streptomyces sp. ME19-01-6]MDX3227127.1 DUF2867 domain-containing protein [Streptomyces sp. ME19-01-6]
MADRRNLDPSQSSSPSSPLPRCLVAGATGYIGSRLVPELLAAGHTVRCLARSPDKLRRHPWAARVGQARGDVMDARSVRAAMEGVDVAYYLVHSLGTGRGFEETDRRAARTFGEQARAAGVRRIVYLGGLTPSGVPEHDLSPHLRSRAEVGRVLLASGVPTAVLRAGVIIGSGSASFEMLRHLTERLPVMVTPRWVRTRTQPIAVRDVLRLLVGCARLPYEVNRAFDIGGPDVVTYRDMMRRYAAVARLPRRLVIPVPVLTPRLSSLWVGLVTPVPGALARPLVESLRHEVVCREGDIARHVPTPRDGPLYGPPDGPLSLDQALRLALRSPAAPPEPSDPLPTDPPWAGGSRRVDHRERVVDAAPEELWQAVERIARGDRWQSLPLAWALRGWLDTVVGRVGLHLGRREAAPLRAGDRLRYWRVEEVEVEPRRRLRLRSELPLPGPAWLEISVGEDGAGGAVYRQHAVFEPHGLTGQLCGWTGAACGGFVFDGMARNVAARAETHAAVPG